MKPEEVIQYALVLSDAVLEGNFSETQKKDMCQMIRSLPGFMESILPYLLMKIGEDTWKAISLRGAIVFRISKYDMVGESPEKFTYRAEWQVSYNWGDVAGDNWEEVDRKIYPFQESMSFTHGQISTYLTREKALKYLHDFWEKHGFVRP